MNDFLYNIINGGLEVVLLCFFFRTFVKPIAWKGRPWALGLMGIAFIGLLCIPKPAPINFGIILLLVLAISMLYKMKWYNHIFLSVLAITLVSMAEIVVAVLSSIVLQLDMAILKTGPYLFSGMLLSKMVIVIVITIIRCGNRTLPLKRSLPLWGFIVFVLFASIVNAFIALDYMYMIINHPIKQILTILSVSFLILINILLFYVIAKINESFETQHNLDTAKQLIEFQKASYQTLFENQKEVRKLRHDLKHAMVGVWHHLEHQQLQEATDFVKEYLQILEENSQSSFSGYSIIETVVDMKRREALKDNITLEHEISFSETLQADTIDLSVLIGNALDNAIEATKQVTHQPKVVTVSITYKQDTLLMVIKNPVNTRVDVECLTSTKKEKDRHGFGILQMKQLAQKYNGEVFFECTDAQFKTSILINSPKGE